MRSQPLPITALATALIPKPVNTLAQEIASLGHGVFTHALMIDIRGQADSFKDSQIAVSELNAYVSNSVAAITKRQKIPTLSVPGGFHEFVLASL